MHEGEPFTVEKPADLTLEQARANAKADPTDKDWQWFGKCIGTDNPNAWFPEKGFATKDEVAEAKAKCAVCPVQQECLEYGLAIGEKFGIYGGKTEKQRRLIRRQRALAGIAINQESEA